MMTVYKLQLLLPYQISFGLQTGFIDFYINRQIVSKYVGEGMFELLKSAALKLNQLAVALVVEVRCPYRRSVQPLPDYVIDITDIVGYIGILTAITTLSAVLVSWPFAKLSNRYQQGKYFVMIFGGCCFLFNGLSLIIMSDEQIGHW
jgi:MFS family permease